jgi:AraC-like DNA-binding protein
MIRREPHPALLPHVRDAYWGYTDIRNGEARSRHLPGGGSPLIINIGEPLSHPDPTRPDAPVPSPQAFFAGLHDRYAVTHSRGESRGVQINFTPIGAYLMAGMPMHELVNTPADAEDVFGAQTRDLIEIMHTAPDWETRFNAVDHFVAARLSRAKPASPAVVWAWQMIADSGGQVSVSELATQIGWSRKHLASQFREYVGMPPKQIARITRFSRAIEAMEAGDERRWTELATSCGYYDQAHFNRDFREFAGVTPSEYLSLRLQDRPGLSDR